MIDSIRTHLLGVTDITDEIGSRFDPFIRVEPGTDKLPACMYEVQSEEVLQPTGLKMSTVQITVMSERVSKSDEVADLVTSNLSIYATAPVKNCKLVSTEREELEPFDGSENYYFMNVQTWEIWHD